MIGYRSERSLSTKLVEGDVSSRFLLDIVSKLSIFYPAPPRLPLTPPPPCPPAPFFQVGRFLNRILGLRIVQQHVLFDYFHNVLEVRWWRVGL